MLPGQYRVQLSFSSPRPSPWKQHPLLSSVKLRLPGREATPTSHLCHLVQRTFRREYGFKQTTNLCSDPQIHRFWFLSGLRGSTGSVMSGVFWSTEHTTYMLLETSCPSASDGPVQPRSGSWWVQMRSNKETKTHIRTDLLKRTGSVSYQDQNHHQSTSVLQF